MTVYEIVVKNGDTGHSEYAAKVEWNRESGTLNYDAPHPQVRRVLDIVHETNVVPERYSERANPDPWSPNNAILEKVREIGPDNPHFIGNLKQMLNETLERNVYTVWTEVD